MSVLQWVITINESVWKWEQIIRAHHVTVETTKYRNAAQQTVGGIIRLTDQMLQRLTVGLGLFVEHNKATYHLNLFKQKVRGSILYPDAESQPEEQLRQETCLGF